MVHNMVVQLEDKQMHVDKFCNEEGNCCSFVGEVYQIKRKPVKLSNDVSKRMVDKIREKNNLEKYEKKYNLEKAKKKRQQERFMKQIPVGDSVLNLEAVDL